MTDANIYRLEVQVPHIDLDGSCDETEFTVTGVVTLPFDNLEAAEITIIEPSPSELTKKEIEWAEELLLQRAEVTERAEKTLQKGLMRAMDMMAGVEVES